MDNKINLDVSNVIHDRVFWIYFIITFLFIIIGITVFSGLDIQHKYLTPIIWIITMFIAAMVVYYISYLYSPKSNNNVNLCVIDPDARCFESNNRSWLFINLIYLGILILSLLWAAEFGKITSHDSRDVTDNIYDNMTSSIITVLIIILGLLLVSISANVYRQNSYLGFTPLTLSIIYVLIWVCIQLYLVLKL